MTPQEAGSDILGSLDPGLAEAHDTADYSIVHPKICHNIASFASNGGWNMPKELRVINSFEGSSFARYKVSAKLTANYLSFASEADFISYANNVIPGIVGPAIDVFVSDNFAEKVRQHDGSSFACENSGNEELNEHLSKLDNLHLYSAEFHRGRALSPGDVLSFYMENEKRRDWLDTLATLITEPKLLSSTGAGFHDGMETFILAHALQILLFAPAEWHQGARYKCADSYVRRFPLEYPEPGPDDVTVSGKYSLEDLYRAVLFMFFLIQQRPEKGEDDYASRTSEKLSREIQLLIIELATSPKVTPTLEPDIGRQRLFRKIQCTSEDSLLALKLTSRGMYQLVKTANPVGAISTWPRSRRNTPILFRIDLEADILRIFHQLPNFMDKDGLRAALPVRRLLLIESKYHHFTPDGTLERFNDYSVSCSPGLMLDKLPKLEEYSLILPAERQSLTMDGLP
ncbi:hypothetical protein FPCIR_12715 [Fusarium pseudocircinatum]|uniref:Uncharacterized protein n=1 Tax=Fusarium pseudocircinatum TaxID=56676 RepID=A0A8H5KP13_9HYPO|nr:hypothetical protein FPCIR_12715 [Fusarium pseudocircinatum]